MNCKVYFAYEYQNRAKEVRRVFLIQKSDGDEKKIAKILKVYSSLKKRTDMGQKLTKQQYTTQNIQTKH